MIFINLNIREIDNSNYQEVLKLTVSKSQEDFIESIEECLAEAKEFSFWRPVAIYHGDLPIGFAMYGLFIDEGDNGRLWLDRLLIDEKYQGMGYGKASVLKLIKRLKDEYNYPEIYLSVYDENSTAIKLYESIGFRFNGEVDLKGEKVMVLNLLHRKLNNA